MYSRHATDRLTRWRVSDPANGAGWGPERALDHGSAVTYSNVYPARDGRLYAFVRAAGLDPHILVSDDEGVSWRAGGRLLNGPGRPYVRYAADHTGRIHILATEQHPHAAADERLSRHHRSRAVAPIRRHGRRPRPVRRRRRQDGTSHERVRGEWRGTGMDRRPPG